MLAFDFEEERIKQEITKLGAKRVLLQMPEGLKPQAPKLAKIVEKSGAVAIISADPCYGACDIAVDEAEGLGVDLILHFGHAKMIKHEQVATIYVETRATVTVDKAVEQSLPLLRDYTKVGISNFGSAPANVKPNKRNPDSCWQDSHNRRHRTNGLPWASQRLQLQQCKIRC